MFLREKNHRNAISLFDTDESWKIDKNEIMQLLSGDEHISEEEV